MHAWPGNKEDTETVEPGVEDGCLCLVLHSAGAASV